MKKFKLLILFLLLLWTSMQSYAQFYTLGKTKYNRVGKEVDPQAVDSAISVNKGMISNKDEIENKYDYVTDNRMCSLPLKSIRVTSGYGMRVHPITRKYCMHNGIDLSANTELVYSMFPGTVKSVSQDQRSGKYVVVQSGNITLSYCHLSKQAVRVGQHVNAGSPIGVAGQTGFATGIHLHLGAKLNGVCFDPTLLLDYVKEQNLGF